MDEASVFFLQNQLEKNTRTYRSLLFDNNFRPQSPKNDCLQIDRDVPRTFHFSEPLEFPISNTELILVSNLESQDILKHALRNVLIAYSRYDKSIGYVQGMNLIVGAILFHCRGDEVSTFWIFVSLIENYEMRQIY